MNFLVIGGDRRLYYAAKELILSGHTVRLRGTPPLGDPFPGEEDYLFADHLILPLPITRGDTVNSTEENPPKLAEIAEHLRPGMGVFGGKIPPGFRDLFEGRGAFVEDYFSDPRLTYENAALTAEGAVFAYMERSPDALSGKNVGIVGFGRIGRHLARLFSRFSCRVTVYARSREALGEIANCGYLPEELTEKTVFLPHNALYNTVPARIFTPDAFARSEKTQVFDLAEGIREAPFVASLQQLRGVPGKYAPRSAGQALGRCILRFLASPREEP